MKQLRVGVIGGGLMGKEVASAFGRWFMLNDVPAVPELVAVADVNPRALDWFRQVSSVKQFTIDYHELLANPEIDVVYAAVPHDLHERIYSDTLLAGKDLLAEKPFGIDLDSASRIERHVGQRFVRCSSEFPFYPGAQRVYQYVRETDLGELLEVNAAFLHSSDMNPAKPINWKRRVASCGQAGVMNDLGLHVLHLPLRLGFVPLTVYAQLQNVVKTRPDGQGGTADCDTWDNATLHCNLAGDVPMRLEMKRLAPGETNSWSLEVLGTKGGVRFSTKHPKTLWTYAGGAWTATDLGHASVFPVATGGIFEFGFPDALMQMWASFLTEREGLLGDRFGCATPEEALQSQFLWNAALRSYESGCAEPLPTNH